MSISGRLYKKNQSDSQKPWIIRDFRFEPGRHLLSYSSKGIIKGAVFVDDLMPVKPLDPTYADGKPYAFEILCYKITTGGEILPGLRSFILAAFDVDIQRKWIATINAVMKSPQASARLESLKLLKTSSTSSINGVTSSGDLNSIKIPRNRLGGAISASKRASFVDGNKDIPLTHSSSQPQSARKLGNSSSTGILSAKDNLFVLRFDQAATTALVELQKHVDAKNTTTSDLPPPIVSSRQETTNLAVEIHNSNDISNLTLEFDARKQLGSPDTKSTSLESPSKSDDLFSVNTCSTTTGMMYTDLNSSPKTSAPKTPENTSVITSAKLHYISTTPSTATIDTNQFVFTQTKSPALNLNTTVPHQYSPNLSSNSTPSPNIKSPKSKTPPGTGRESEHPSTATSSAASKISTLNLTTSKTAQSASMSPSTSETTMPPSIGKASSKLPTPLKSGTTTATADINSVKKFNVLNPTAVNNRKLFRTQDATLTKSNPNAVIVAHSTDKSTDSASVSELKSIKSVWPPKASANGASIIVSSSSTIKKANSSDSPSVFVKKTNSSDSSLSLVQKASSNDSSFVKKCNTSDSSLKVKNSPRSFLNFSKRASPAAANTIPISSGSAKAITPAAVKTVATSASKLTTNPKNEAIPTPAPVAVTRTLLSSISIPAEVAITTRTNVEPAISAALIMIATPAVETSRNATSIQDSSEAELVSVPAPAAIQLTTISPHINPSSELAITGTVSALRQQFSMRKGDSSVTSVKSSPHMSKQRSISMPSSVLGSSMKALTSTFTRVSSQKSAAVKNPDMDITTIYTDAYTDDNELRDKTSWLTPRHTPVHESSPRFSDCGTESHISPSNENSSKFRSASGKYHHTANSPLSHLSEPSTPRDAFWTRSARSKSLSRSSRPPSLHAEDRDEQALQSCKSFSAVPTESKIAELKGNSNQSTKLISPFSCDDLVSLGKQSEAFANESPQAYVADSTTNATTGYFDYSTPPKPLEQKIQTNFNEFTASTPIGVQLDNHQDIFVPRLEDAIDAIPPLSPFVGVHITTTPRRSLHSTPRYSVSTPRNYTFSGSDCMTNIKSLSRRSSKCFSPAAQIIINIARSQSISRSNSTHNSPRVSVSTHNTPRNSIGSQVPLRQQSPTGRLVTALKNGVYTASAEPVVSGISTKNQPAGAILSSFSIDSNFETHRAEGKTSSHSGNNSAKQPKSGRAESRYDLLQTQSESINDTKLQHSCPQQLIVESRSNTVLERIKSLEFITSATGNNIHSDKTISPKFSFSSLRELLRSDKESTSRPPSKRNSFTANITSTNTSANRRSCVRPPQQNSGDEFECAVVSKRASNNIESQQAIESGESNTNNSKEAVAQHTELTEKIAEARKRIRILESILTNHEVHLPPPPTVIEAVYQSNTLSSTRMDQSPMKGLKPFFFETTEEQMQLESDVDRANERVKFLESKFRCNGMELPPPPVISLLDSEESLVAGFEAYISEAAVYYPSAKSYVNEVKFAEFISTKKSRVVVKTKEEIEEEELVVELGRKLTQAKMRILYLEQKVRKATESGLLNFA